MWKDQDFLSSILFGSLEKRMILQKAQQLSEDEHPQALRGLQERHKKPLQHLARKAQQGNARRDEQKAKLKAKAMAEFLQPPRDEPQGPRGPQHPGDGGGHKHLAQALPSSARQSRPKQPLARNQGSSCRPQGHCKHRQQHPQHQQVQP